MVSSPTRNIFERLVEVAFFLAFWVAAIIFYQNVFNNDYSITDSHMFIRIENALSEQGFWTTLSERVNSEGRYRPMFWTPVILFTQVFGSNFLFSKIFYIVLWSLSSFFLYRIALTVIESRWFAFIFSVMTLMGPQIIGAYFCGAAESFGIFFVSLGMLLFLTQNAYRPFTKSLGVLVLIMACFTKETFMVVMPSILLLLLYLEYLRGEETFFAHIKQNFLWFVPIGLACLYIVYYIFAKGIEGGSYAGLGGGNMSLLAKLSKSYKGMNHYVIKYFAILSVLLMVGLAIWNVNAERYSKRKLGWVIGLGMITAFFLIIPQLYVYSKSGLYQRYFLPISMGFSVLFLVSTFLLEKVFNKAWLKYAVVVASIGLIGVEYQRSVKYGVNDFYTKCRQITKALDHIKKNVKDKEGNILLVGDPALDFELLNNSLPSYFTLKHKYENLDVYLIDHQQYKFPYLQALKAAYKRKHADKIVYKDKDIAYDAVMIMPETFWHKTGINYEHRFDAFNKQGEQYLNFEKKKFGNFIVYTQPQIEKLTAPQFSENKEEGSKEIDKKFSFVLPGKPSLKNTLYWINSVNDISYQQAKSRNNQFKINGDTPTIQIKGWAIDEPNKTSPSEVYIKIGQRAYKCTFGNPTPWVAQNYGMQYQNVGFSVEVPVEDLPNESGKFPLQCVVLNKDNEQYVNTNPLVKDKQLYLDIL